MSKYPLFDRNKLKLLPLSARHHLLTMDVLRPLKPVPLPLPEHLRSLYCVAKKMNKAKREKRAIIFMIGAHVIRSGVQRYLIDLMKKGYISSIGVNGACVIHDFEFSLIGKTTESVAKYIKVGQFGLWKELEAINECVKDAYKNNLGIGEAIGKMIMEGTFTYRNLSIFANAYKYEIPVTVHVGIGYDIVHELPGCDGSAWGGTSYTDFLIFAEALRQLSHGVVLNFGSAVMAPEIFLKALSMARNLEAQEGKSIAGFTTCVCDIKKLPKTHREEPSKHDPDYYFRPWKTMLVRAIEQGNSFYVCGDHGETVPALWTVLMDMENEVD